MKTLGVECPECGDLRTRVQQSNLDVDGHRVRARICQECGALFSTLELPVPGLSFARTQRSLAPNPRLGMPQRLRVRERKAGVSITVIEPVRVPSCHSGRHPWIAENIYTNPSGRKTCRLCRLDNARDRYHNARRKAPPSILESQRAYWRKRYRIRRERAA